MKRFVLRDGVAKTTVTIAPKESEYAETSPSSYFAPRMKSVCGSHITGLVDRALVHLLPKDFSKGSVPREYFSFTTRHFVAAVFGSASFVLSTQSLLVAIGLGAGALPIAATLNWVLKDGLGQLGGVLFASLVNNRFDTDPKRWRFVAACSQDAAMFLEALTPLFPAMFLPMAVVANMGKNVSWLTASATKASIHLSFALKGNLADITAKAGSQNVVASTMGTSLGISIAALVVGDTGTSVLLPCLIGLSSAHLFCLYSALGTVNLNTLNAQRTEIAARSFILDDESVLNPSQVSKNEIFVGRSGTYLLRGYDDSKMLRPRLREGHDISKIPSLQREDVGQHTFRRLERDRYGIVELDDELIVLLREDASAENLLRARLEAAHLRISRDKAFDFASSEKYVNENGKRFYDLLCESGWNTEHAVFEDREYRVKFLSAADNL
eukprot:g3945.t1